MERPGACFHCGEPVPAGPPILARLKGDEQPMCCHGCKAVAEFIDASGWQAFYEHRDAPDVALRLTPETADWQRYDTADLMTRYVHVADGHAEATIDIGGMYCSACVWLLDNAMRRLDGVVAIDVNPATKRSVIRWQPDRLNFSDVLQAIASVGFRPAPVGAGDATLPGEDDRRLALKRLIVAAAAGMQVMMFAVALYAGDYFGIEGSIEKFLRTISLLVTLPIVFYSARPFFAGAIRGLRAARPGMDLPVSLAIAAAFTASAYATWIDAGDIYFDSVAMFVFFLSATRFLEMRARHRADDHALALAQLMPDLAVRMVRGRATTVAVDQLRAGDIVRIRPGDILPADGTLVSGELSVDESMLTGESLPTDRAVGTAVFAGSIVRRGNAMVSIDKTGASTSLAEIGRMLERAKADRPPVALLADRIAGYFVLGVLALATAAGIAWSVLEPSRTFEVILATLVVTCPCALALATPAAIAAATVRLSRSGFLLVRARLLETLTRASVIVFDKTGTLTEGCPVVLRTTPLRTAGPDTDALLAIAAAIETASEHVLARAFAPFHAAESVTADELKVVPGLGVEASVDGTHYRIGAAGFVGNTASAAGHPEPDSDQTAVYLGDSDGLLARFDIGDELRADARTAIDALRDGGLRPVIASGDREGAVRRVAVALGIDDWHAGLSPADKLALIRDLRAAGHTVVMVGDGINDAPVLAAADGSIALDAGTALARASADAVSLGRTLGSIVTATRIAVNTQRVIRQNIAWAIVYNLTAVPLAMSGLLAPWMAALGMSASSLIVVLNALRLHRLPTHRTADTHGHRALAHEAVS